MHLLAEHIKVLKLVDRTLRRIHRVVDDESLAFALQTLLRNDIDDVAIFGEDIAESFDEGWDLDLLVEVSDLFIRSVCATHPGLMASSFIRRPCEPGQLWRETLRLFVRCAVYERCVGRCLAVFACHDETRVFYT